MRLAVGQDWPKTIDSYRGGVFRMGRLAQRGSVLLMPEGVRPWRVADVRQISFDALRPLCRGDGGFDTLLLGTGKTLNLPAPAVLEALRRAGLRVEAMPTAAACRTYNAVVTEGRAVAAALIAVH